MGRPPHPANDPALEWDPLQACLDYIVTLRERTHQPASPPETSPAGVPNFAARVGEWARAATHASGAVMAVAVNGGDIVCVGRSGLAPELGVRLDRSAGISGRCIRTGELQLCRDTVEDESADPEACAQMGVRSLAMVPLKKNGTVIGLLGVFSDRPAHFDRHHLGILRYLEGIVAEGLNRIAEQPANAAQAQAAR